MEESERERVERIGRRERMEGKETTMGGGIGRREGKAEGRREEGKMGRRRVEGERERWRRERKSEEGEVAKKNERKEEGGDKG